MNDPDDKNQLRVRMNDSRKRSYVYELEKRGVGYSASYPVVSGTFGNNVGTWWENEIPLEDLGLTYTFFAWAFDYTNRELQGTGQELGPNLKIRVSSNSSAARYVPLNVPKSITLGMQTNEPAYIRERTIFHEFGHYVFYHFHGHWNWFWTNGNHSGRFNNESSKLTMSEGVANGFAGIMNEMTWSIFGQISNQRLYHQRPFFRNTGDAIADRNPNNARLNHPYLSENYLASVMLDLWDGTQNYAAYNNTNFDGPDFRDEINNINMDNFEMSFKDICRPFWEKTGDVNSIEEYFHFLIKNASCNQRPAIRRIFQFNSEEIDNATITNQADFPVFSSDEIFTERQITAIGFDIKNNDETEEKNRDFDQKVNMQVMSGSANSYNVTRFQRNTPFIWIRSHGDVGLSDNHRVENNARLQIHGNEAPRFYNNTPSGTTYTQFNGDMQVSLCSGTRLEIGEDGTLEIGSISPARNADFYIKPESVVVLETGGDLVINNNSTFIIEVGGRLDIHPGARIILNGPNAVLEVKGQIRLIQNADFTVEGGAQGFGYIKFHKNMNNNPKLLDGLGNNNITLTGTGTTHRLIEITGNEGWQIPPSITNVDISDCKITLGGGSRLNLENNNRFRLNNVDVDKITSLQSRHKGIYVWGWGMYSEIENVTIKGGIQGLLYYPIHRDEQFSDAYLNSRKVLKTHIVKNSRFEDNITGVKSIRVPIWLIDNEIDGYHTHGVRTYGTLSRDVYMVNNLIDNSGSGSSTLDTGVSFWGGIPMTNLLFRKNSVSGNRIGLYGFQTRVIPGCNTIENNNQIGITMEGRADLFMNNVFNFGGYNTLNNNNSNILSRYWGRTSLNGGVNYFDMGSGVQFALFGNLVPYDPISYIANNNVFNVTVDPFLSPPVHSWSDVVNSGKNGYFKYEYSPSGLRNFSNVNIFNPTLIGNMITAECGKTEWETVPVLTNGVPPALPVTYHDIVDMDNFPGGSYIIVTNDYWNVPIKDVLADLYLRAIELDGETPSDIVTSYVDIFENSYTPIDSTREIFYELYSQMHGNLSYWINSGTVNTRVNDSLQEDNVFQQIADLIDGLIEQSATDSMHFLFDSEFNLQVEKIELMRAASNYGIALNLIENLKPLVFSDPAKNFVLTKVECITNVENELFLGNYSPDSLLTVFGECLDLYFDDPYFDSISGELKISSHQEVKSEKESIQIWPTLLKTN